VKRVLIVDDEPDIGSLVALCLDPLGIDVVQASGLSGALRIAREDDIGLVLLDLALGDEDGLDILPQLRGEPGLFGVPVVAFTAHDSRRREALDCGIDSFLPRPFASADLQSTVGLYLIS
jgi:two-component system, OmpR family, alkaline phosphatase synthesis response regulator PhoP